MNDLLHKNSSLVAIVCVRWARRTRLAYVAQGAFDAYVDLTNTTKEWDWAAGSCLIREAGGEYRELASGVRTGRKCKIIAAIERVLAR
jgi:fructose-1,6-bisphosphatase/inositol monophosphatase family enzyme